MSKPSRSVRRRLSVTLLALPVMLGGVVAVTAGPAMAATTIIANTNTNRCMDDSTSFGVRSWFCDGLGYQQWTIRSGGGIAAGYVQFQNSAPGTGCIDDTSPGSAYTDAPCNAATVTEDFKETSHFDPPTGRTWVILTNKSTNYCADDSWGAGLRSFPCNLFDTQGWHI